MVKMNKVVRGLVVLATACNVPAPPSATGGAKGATLEIVCSDFKSTNVALAKCDGTILSGSFVSSAATAPGLVTALSGDVEVPFVAPTSGRAVIIDRSSNVLTWMDAETAKVISQLEHLSTQANAPQLVSSLLKQFDVVTGLSAWSDPKRSH